MLDRMIVVFDKARVVATERQLQEAWEYAHSIEGRDMGVKLEELLTPYPIAFSRPMVEAILQLRKTQTRRVMRPQPSEEWTPDSRGTVQAKANGVVTERPIGWGQTNADGDEAYKCPYRPGRVLWVREGCWLPPAHITERDLQLGADTWRVTYDTDIDPRSNELECLKKWGWRHRVPRYMPRTACRLFLKVVDVRAQRIQDITIEDIREEGIAEDTAHVRGTQMAPVARHGRFLTQKESGLLWDFWGLWNGLNSSRGRGWHDNPWVWAIRFELIGIRRPLRRKGDTRCNSQTLSGATSRGIRSLAAHPWAPDARTATPASWPPGCGG